ncbi:hypothetical protein MTO96_010578 [Rhipicephalus appendiculatus]
MFSAAAAGTFGVGLYATLTADDLEVATTGLETREEDLREVLSGVCCAALEVPTPDTGDEAARRFDTEVLAAFLGPAAAEVRCAGDGDALDGVGLGERRDSGAVLTAAPGANADIELNSKRPVLGLSTTVATGRAGGLALFGRPRVGKYTATTTATVAAPRESRPFVGLGARERGLGRQRLAATEETRVKGPNARVVSAGPGGMEGPLSVWTSFISGWHLCWVVLDDRNGMLYRFKSHQQRRKRLGLLAKFGGINLLGAIVTKDPKEPNGFSVVSEGREYRFQAPSEEERDTWVMELEESVPSTDGLSPSLPHLGQTIHRADPGPGERQVAGRWTSVRGAGMQSAGTRQALVELRRRARERDGRASYETCW